MPPHDTSPDSPVHRELHLRLVRDPSTADDGSSGRGTDELEALLTLSERLLAAEDRVDIAAGLLEAVVTTYGFARGAVLSGDQRLSVVSGHAVLETSAGSGTSDAVKQAQVARAPRLLRSLDADSEPWLARILPSRSSVLVVPLTAEEHRLGALVVQVPAALRGAQRIEVVGQLERAGRSAALALQRVHRLEQLQRLAATDDLTMIANRRSFAATLERELARSTRSGEPVSLVILDIDHFKQVNDNHGHIAGDETLRNVAAALAVACREFDTPARYGGEEFAVILPDCSTDRCEAIADRLREAVAAAPGPRPLTASAGVATFPAHASDSDQLVHAADEALLKAKRAGRDRTVVAQPQAEKPGPAAGGSRRAARTPVAEE